jgi:zinc protease
MKRIYIAIALVAVISYAEAQKSTAPAGGVPKDFKLPAKKQGSLENGLKYNLVQYGSIPKVNINLIVKTGNVHEAANQVWLADLTVQLMEQGTGSMDFATISKKVAGMGGNINMNVGMDQVSITGSVLAEFAPRLVRVIADMVMNPAFPEKEVERLKADLKRQLSVQRSVPQSLAQEKFFGTIYPDHPYGRYFPTDEMLSSYDLAAVKSFYDKNFGARRSVMYVVGVFNQDSVAHAIDQAFKGWKEGPEVDYPVATPAKSNQISLIDRPNAPQSTIMLGIPVPDPSNADFQALQTTNSLLGGSFGSRITSNIRENKGYTYSPFSTIQSRHRVAVWYEQADVTSEHTGASLQEISKEIKRLQTEPPSKEELAGIQNYEAGIFVLQNSTPAGIIGQLNFIDQHGLDDSYLTNKVKNIYAVTPEKVSEVMRQYFKYEDMTLVMVGDKKLLEKQIKANKEAIKSK